jgi:ATP-dependent DNA helicase RecQ
MSNPATPQPESLLPRFGLSAFREGQDRVISTVLAGRDCLCVMPTGGGKSLCYQLPALMLEGLTLVVSPLIALMKDQVDQLQARNLPVSYVNSALPQSEQYERLERMAAGEFRLVYVSPERFRNSRFMEAVRQSSVKLLAVDEAHCISEWGHDFRPDYARLGYFRRQLGNPTTIALTATATDRVRRDIIEQLALNDPKTYITGFARPNLFYQVQQPAREHEKPHRLIEFLKNNPGAGIIYTSSRKGAEEVAKLVSEQCRRRAAAYHAGLLPDQRRKTQEDFMAGRCEIVAATNAFGMGIDKADVRFVVHYNLPGSIEAYYQEAGRAGRDGLPSRCLMLFHYSDKRIQEFFIDNAFPDREYVEEVYDFLCGREENPIELTQEDVKQSLGLPIGAEGVGNCEKLLESAGVLERLIAAQNKASARIDSDLPTLVDLLPKQATARRKVLRAVERVIGSRRQEMVQFRIGELGLDAEMDRTTIAHYLRQLNELDAFSYVPPFRGRAIRMIRRDLPFEKLDIDFEALEKRKQAELEKLDRVIDFARGHRCRQEEILRYFGDRSRGPCGHCDNCRKRGGGRGAGNKGEERGERREERAKERGLGTSEPSNSPDNSSNAVDGPLLEVFRMVLSGVARTEARFPCGRNLIAQMLCGSQSAKIKKLRLDKLSTFGLLGHLLQTEVGQLIDTLIELGCLEQNEIDRFRPVIELTEFGGEVMRGRATIDREPRLPASLLLKLNVIKGQGPSASAASDRKEGGAEKREENKAERGKRKTNDDCGQGAVASGRKKETSNPQVPRPKVQDPDFSILPSPVPRRQSPEEKSSVYWTRRLLLAGFTIEECAAIRGLPRETIEAHARQENKLGN